MAQIAANPRWKKKTPLLDREVEVYERQGMIGHNTLVSNAQTIKVLRRGGEEEWPVVTVEVGFTATELEKAKDFAEKLKLFIFENSGITGNIR